MTELYDTQADNYKYERFTKRRIIDKRYVIQFVLTLESPTLVGNGVPGDLVDLPIHLDPLEGKPLLTGATIAGALRSHLCDVLHGYRKLEDSSKKIGLLFGGKRGDENGE